MLKHDVLKLSKILTKKAQTESFDKLYGGIKISILNTPRLNEKKYNIIITDISEPFTTNSKDAFINQINLILKGIKNS